MSKLDGKAESATATPATPAEYELTLVQDKREVSVGLSHYVAIYLWIGWFSFFFYLPLWGLLLWLLCPSLLGLAVAAIVASAIYPIQDRYQPKWAFRLGEWLMLKAMEYFRIRLYCEGKLEDIDGCGPSFMTIEPHDVLPVGLVAYSNARGVNPLPSHIIRGALASACFQMPLLRHFYSWARATNIERKTLHQLLSTKQTVCICPGGAHEVTYMDPSVKRVDLQLKNRFGFIKIAMQHGANIIPTYAFGQRNAWDFWVPQWDWLLKIGRKNGFIPLVFCGLWGIPFAQAKSVPIDVVMGRPIIVEKVAEGTEITTEMMQPIMDQFIAANERLFERNKQRFGMGDYSLVIH